MIYSYGLKNYFGFKEGAEVSFLLNNKVPESISQGRDYSTILGVKGANGSGKTNLLKALGFLSQFCTKSFSNKDENKIDVNPYYSSKEPSEFYIEFRLGDVHYRYELGVTRDEIHYEKIYRKNIKSEGSGKKTRMVLVLERIKNEINSRLEEISSVDFILLKNNASIISTAYNYKFQEPLEILNDVYSFFMKIITNITYVGLNDLGISSERIIGISAYYFQHKEAFNFAKNIIIESDLGISDIKIKERLDDDGNTEYYPVFYHAVDDNEFYLTSYEESSGTRSLYIKLYLYWVAITFGGVLVLDEFDLNCHPFILPKLLALFEDEEINKDGAQFVFTSHITEVMDKLSKYRTYLVNKDNNESYCYRLDEIGGDILRHGRPISPIYNEGKIGGVPRI
ncbi:ATP/GTP-binding protein [Pectobacterium sp. CHL-2024]|uniref:AAA family ATPase n=1 Tax=Pectobacterium TaxID=122277 RepID=UPI001EFA4C20|nr:ATP-binding protein [Pectobacterium carotovorum]